MIKFYKLFDLLNRREMKKTDLLEIMSSETLSRFSKGGNIGIDIVAKVCAFLNVQPATSWNI